MSWNGTVRCSWCYGSGHNKTSCPRAKSGLKTTLTLLLREQGEKQSDEPRFRRRAGASVPIALSVGTLHGPVPQRRPTASVLWPL